MSRGRSARRYGRRWLTLGLALAAGMTLAACRPQSPPGAIRGAIVADGSSTVFPLTEAMAEAFAREHPGVQVTVGTSGTGGGFQRFCRGETALNNASRPIKPSEIEACRAHGIDFIEIPVAYDGITVVVHPDNEFVDHLTVAELRRIWEPGSPIRRWRQVRPTWPDRELHLYGPGSDSGTFDYFTEAVIGESGRSRSDYTASEDDHQLVIGVSGDPDALGYFGYAYYVENRGRLRAVPIDGGEGPVPPTEETIRSGRYRPLSRPLFIYVSTKAVERPEVQAFVRFYLEHADELVKEVGYVPLSATAYQQARRRFDERITGTMFGEGSAGELSLEERLARSQRGSR